MRILPPNPRRRLRISHMGALALLAWAVCLEGAFAAEPGPVKPKAKPVASEARPETRLKPQFRSFDPPQYFKVIERKPAKGAPAPSEEFPAFDAEEMEDRGELQYLKQGNKVLIRARYTFPVIHRDGHLALAAGGTKRVRLTRVDTDYSREAPETRSAYLLETDVVARIQKVKINFISPYGRVEKRDFFVVTGKPVEELAWLAGKRDTGKRWVYAFGMGVTRQGFAQTGYPVVSQYDWTIKGGVTYRFPGDGVFSSWEAGLSGYSTVLPLSTSPSRFRSWFYGLNGRVARLFEIAPRLTFGASLGYYYASMSTPAEEIGYRNLSGPQIYPFFRARTPDGRYSYGGYIKYSPVAQGFSLFSLVNREFAFGFNVGKRLRNGMTLGATYDFANLNFTAANGSALQNFVHSVSAVVSL